ncbi:MAG: SufE family protein [Bacteriovoracaceae bacterium]|nr:SufE family protein [Bacteriovoracaceae bacterium]
MSDIQERIAQIKKRFGAFSDWEDRYKELISVGKEMPLYPEEERLEKFKVKGCQSQVWLFPKLVEGRVRLAADSDALLVKGIIALLVHVYDNCTPQEILSDRAEFLKDIGITEHLSMNRTNGLASMLKQIQMYALVYQSMSQGKV